MTTDFWCNLLCRSSEELFSAADSFARQELKKDDLLLLYGPLGAGKTLFAKGLCNGLGIDPNTVSSPTFTLMHVYESDFSSVAHFDLYRLSEVEEFFLIGGGEVLGRQLCLIEWPQLVEHILPTDYVRVDIEILTDGTRRLSVARKIGEKN